jgi:hypothetical protein
LPNTRKSGAGAITICVQACAVFLWVSTSSVYRIEEQDVVILHVMHGSRDIADRLENSKKLPARPSLWILQLRLAALGLLALGLGDIESAAANVFCFVDFVFRQTSSPR